MMAPPGDPKTTSTLSATRASQIVCAPVLFIGLAFSERGKKKSPATFRCGARSCRNLSRSERWPAPLAKEAKKAKANKDEGARVGCRNYVYASRAAIHPLQV